MEYLGSHACTVGHSSDIFHARVHGDLSVSIRLAFPFFSDDPAARLKILIQQSLPELFILYTAVSCIVVICDTLDKCHKRCSELDIISIGDVRTPTAVVRRRLSV